MSSWDIIIWTLEDASDVVPTSWAANPEKTMYLYPKGLKMDKILKQIRNCKEPSHKFSYEELPAICKKTINRYEEANKYLKKLECESNLESGNENRNDEHGNENQEKLPQCQIISNSEKPKEYKQILALLTKIDNDNTIILNEIKLLQYEYKNLTISQKSGRDEWPTSLPLKTEEEFTLAEAHLPEKNSALVCLISLVGGNSMRHYISLMVKKLLAKDLALKYSGQGKKGKKSFCSTKLFAVILEASRIRDAKVTDMAVTQYISLGLASAGDWDGGNARKKNKIVDENNPPEQEDVPQ